MVISEGSKRSNNSKFAEQEKSVIRALRANDHAQKSFLSSQRGRYLLAPDPKSLSNLMGLVAPAQFLE